VKNQKRDIFDCWDLQMIVEILMIKSVQNVRLHLAIEFGEVTNPSILIHLPFNLDGKLIPVAVHLLALPVLSSVELMCSFECKMSANFRLQEISLREVQNVLSFADSGIYANTGRETMDQHRDPYDATSHGE